MHIKAERDWQIRVDLGKQLIVLQEIATSNLRPEAQRVVYFVEVTVQWEGAVAVVYIQSWQQTCG